jgi:hypothetical protein
MERSDIDGLFGHPAVVRDQSAAAVHDGHRATADAAAGAYSVTLNSGAG